MEHQVLPTLTKYAALPVNLSLSISVTTWKCAQITNLASEVSTT